MLSSILILRIWQAVAGLVTTLLVLNFLTPELQGWYYSFLSIAALHTLFDLGLSIVLVQISAHVSVGLRWERGFSYSGECSHTFSALVISALRWYFLLAIIFVMTVLPGGYYFFSFKADVATNWEIAWFLLCLAVTGSLILMPFLSLLEGAGQIAFVYRLRLTQSVLGSIGCWLMLILGAELLSTAMVALIAAGITSVWLLLRARSLLLTAWQQRHTGFSWRLEVWPLQWRLGISCFSGYMLTQIYIPILFYMEGPILAGQFGLSLAVVNTLGLVSQSWFTRHVPMMAQAVVAKEWKILDDLFYRDLAQSIVVFSLCALALLFGYLIFNESPIVNRLLPFWPFTGLIIYAFISLLVSAWATHLRSFKREPLLPLICFCTFLMVPSMLVATRWYSINGMVAVLNIVYLFILLPGSWLVWHRANRILRDTP